MEDIDTKTPYLFELYKLFKGLTGLFSFFLAIFLPSIVGRPIVQIQKAYCGSDVFYYSSGILYALIENYLVFMAFWLSPFVIFGCIMSCIRFERKQPNFRTFARKTRFMGIMIFVSMAIIIFLSIPKYCLSPTQITFYKSPWASPTHYAWSDVSEIRTACTTGRRGSEADMSLVMIDGTVMNILGTYSQWEGFTRIYPDFVHALRNTNFKFSSGHFSPKCINLYGSFLTERPQ